MSWKATAYVKELRKCPNGELLIPSEKLLLFVLADYHNTKYDIIWPNQETLAEDAMCSERTVRRLVDDLCKKGVLEVVPGTGRGSSRYRFKHLCADTREDNLSSQGGHEGGHGGYRNKEEPVLEPVNTLAASQPELHSKVRTAIQELHKKKFSVLVEWDASEAKALNTAIKANPSRDWDAWRKLILHRYQSDDINGDRPRRWLANIGRWADGPHNEFGRAKSKPEAEPVQEKTRLTYEERKALPAPAFMRIRQTGEPA